MRGCLIGVISLTLAFASSSAAQPSAKRVLILHSFATLFAPDATVARDFREELSRRSPVPVDFLEMSLQPAPSAETAQEELVASYVRSTVAAKPMDLIVTLSAPAAVFAQKHRARMFPTTPVLYSTVDRRFVENRTLTAMETAVAADTDPARVVDGILRDFPQTTHVFVVIGHSPLEQFWFGEVRKAFERFNNRLTFIWSHDFSYAETLKRSAALPPHSAILYLLLSVDGKGFSQTEERTLADLSATANAPVFGLFSTQLGRGIVGGSLLSIDEIIRHSADVALRILRGESPGTINTPLQEHGAPTYDGRQLQRWGISESRLPAGSVVQFRQPGVWDQYKLYIVGATTLVALESALIAGLVVQSVRRRRMELALRESERHFRVMADTAPVMIWRSGVENACDFFNKPWLDFRGRTLEQEQGSGWLEGIHPDDVAQCRHASSHTVPPREPFEKEYRLRRADGEYRWVLDVGVPRYDDSGRLAGFIGSAIDITERKRIEQSLRESEAALREVYEQNQDLAGRLLHAQEEERARIARDLHDDVSQQLAGVGIMLSALKRGLNRPGAQPQLDETVAALQERTSALVQAIRHLSHDLHPGVLKHAGLVAALTQHCAEVQRHHRVNVTCTAGDDFEALEFDVALCLYRVTQEALTNVVRHARASSAQVQLRRTDTHVELRVNDDGIGFVATERARSGLGLRSIDERVRLTGGHVRVESPPGLGTRLLVQIPLAAVPAELVPDSEPASSVVT